MVNQNEQNENVRPQSIAGQKPIKFAYPSGAKPLDGYTIKRGVGVGGFGDVYYAKSDAGKEVALKRIQRNLDVELRGVKQCLNLKHQNLVGLYDIRYDDEGQAWVVMEYVAGDSMQDAIERNPNGLPIDQVQKWFRGIADGVSYLHDHGIVHRDLKPGNIFSDNGQIKIGDYGLAKFISCSRRSGQTESVGTFHYMAPEIGLGRYGKEIDIYALGILLFELLTGRVPFDGESSQEIIMKHLTAEPDLSLVSQPYRQVIRRAMQKDPEKRFRSVQEMIAAMESPQYETGKSQHANPVLAEVINDDEPQEPIAKAAKEFCSDVNHKWNSPGMTAPIKAIIIVAIVMLLGPTGLGLPFLKLAILGGFAYCIYYVVWTILVSSTGSKQPKQKQKQKPYPTAKSDVAKPEKPKVRKRLKPLTRQQLTDAMRESMAEKGKLQHIKELTGSMLMAAIVCAVFSVFLLLIGMNGPESSQVHRWGPIYGWMVASSTIGAWAVLFMSKFWEATPGDQALRRFCMLTSGLLVGTISGGIASGLMLEPSYILQEFRNGVIDHRFPGELYTVAGAPRLLAFVCYFGIAFGLFRWWLSADPLRQSRLSFFTTAFCIFVAVLMHRILPIPRGFLVIGTTLVAVQLSAPWVDSLARKRFQKKLEHSRQVAEG